MDSTRMAEEEQDERTTWNGTRKPEEEEEGYPIL